ncbi:MAG TPA: hypothetical protein VKE88_02305 [Candidatus Nanoarchaeia archaeon]|nr:hypothetical protein [Candidatus Nanoarchaeia archaeon]
MNIIQRALDDLGITKPYITELEYSGHFKDYGANIKVYPGKIILKISSSWKDISDEIVIGLAQELLVKIFKLKKKTLNIDLYNSFIRNVHIAVPKVVPDPDLLASFNRVNDKYFSGMMDIPNIVWGEHSTRKLGSYDYRIDRIVMSTVLKGNETFLDMTMHHELLHKKHKFKSTHGRSLHHSTAFRKEEHSFENYDENEKLLKQYLMKNKMKRMFKFW